ncbi:PAS domain S-box protein [Lutibacter sp. TH_r2]|uniref:PAS domain S-box protein n=1 Tax=Lutibacter sp. TH_r2 TaxID=3082083 RepID=UPI002953C7BD|nr:PAS domain S-box protein [Lutibacter sp. TH_r2]MDV7188010.1 PAS domain S-box protein [Lutibacter sp. TH_r2]
MPNIYFDQILFLFLQCFIVATLLLSLFRLRTIFGLSLLYTALGVFQYMQVFLANALYFEIMEGVYISSGSSVMFTGSLFAILIVYIKEDALEARKIIYAILSANIVLSILQFMVSINLDGERTLNIFNIPKEVFIQNRKILITGTILLFIDTFSIIFLYETISKYTKHLFFRILISMVSIIAIDTILFTFIAFYGTKKIYPIIISGLVSKSFAALIYAILYTLYLKFVENKNLILEIHDKAFKDIFHTLTFRQKYEHIYQENISKTNKLDEATTIINRSPSVAFLWKNDENWTVEYVSKNVVELCGYSEQDILEGTIDYKILIHPDDLERVIKEVRTAKNNPEITKFSHLPYRIITKQNKIKWVQDDSFIRKDVSNNITHFEGIIYDITEKVEAEKKLILNEEKYRTLFEYAPEGILIANKDGWYIDANTVMCKMLGYTHKQITSFHSSEILIENEIKNINKALKTIISNKTHSKEWRFKRKNGSEFSADVTATSMPDGTILAIVKDITERKTLESALLNEKTQLKAIIDNIPVMLTLYDPNIEMLFLNKEFKTKLGVTAKDNSEINFMELFYPDPKIRKQAEEFMLKAPNEWKEFPLTTKKGNVLNTEWTNIILENGTKIGIGLDITEKKKTKIELNKTKNILLNTLENMTDGFVSLDPEWNYNFVNKKAGEIFGKKPEELIHKNIWKEFPEGINQPFYKNYYKASETQKPIIFEDYYSPMDEWFENKIIPSNDGLAIFFQNITDRKNSEKALLEFNKRLKILHNIDSAILNADSPKQIAINVLSKLKKIIPYTHASITEYHKNIDAFKFLNVNTEIPDLNVPNEFVPASQFDFLDKELLFKGNNQIIKNLNNLPIKSSLVKKAMDFGLNSVIVIPLTSENVLVGTMAIFSKSIKIFTKNNIKILREIGNQLAIVIHQNNLKNQILKYTEDLEEKIAERTAQLEFSNRELRDFAQIVSHDLKAPLRAISQLSHWVSVDYSDKLDAEGKEHLAMLVSRVKRMDNLIEGVLKYSRAGKAREKEIPINLNTIVKEVIQSLHPPKNIKITIDHKLPEISGDPTRFGQLFQNLINNAIKFIDKPKGIINIGCEKINNNWQFYVSDNGPGIEEKYHDRIFQIFQRLESRDNQEGTGIGLTLVKRILQIYGGEIWIKSELEKGSTFYFTLPINK